MRKRRTSQIQKQYRFEEETNAYLIEVSLEDYNDMEDTIHKFRPYQFPNQVWVENKISRKIFNKLGD